MWVFKGLKFVTKISFVMVFCGVWSFTKVSKKAKISEKKNMRPLLRDWALFMVVFEGVRLG